jgi:glutathione S-transferase
MSQHAREEIDADAPEAVLPVLWQLPLSHYNEKVRWALDYKRIAHMRCSLLPGAHAVKAQRLTGDVSTTPVLTIDGQSIGDSTRIIAAIEQRWPDPPLYPEQPSLLGRALELEEFFDEQLGPHIRRVVYAVLVNHPELLVPLFARDDEQASERLLERFPALRAGIEARFEITAETAAQSRTAVIAAMDRLEREISSSGYLVGASFTIADLTAAALLYGVARPPEFPYAMISHHDLPASLREFVDSLAQRSGGQWVAQMYRRHRGRSTEVTSPTTTSYIERTFKNP